MPTTTFDRTHTLELGTQVFTLDVVARPSFCVPADRSAAATAVRNGSRRLGLRVGIGTTARLGVIVLGAPWRA